MVFSEPFFLFAFLPLALALISATGGRLRNGTILVLSLVFYYWSSGLLTGLIVFSIIFNFIVGRYVGTGRSRLLMFGVTVNVLLLVYFKYAWFLADTVDGVIGTGNADFFSTIILPVGISFFTFQSISYLIDIARGPLAHRVFHPGSEGPRNQHGNNKKTPHTTTGKP